MKNSFCAPDFAWQQLLGLKSSTIQVPIWGSERGVPGIPYHFKYFEKYPKTLKRNGQISPKFTPLQKALYHHILKSNLNFQKSIPYPFKYLAIIPKNPSRASHMGIPCIKCVLGELWTTKNSQNSQLTQVLKYFKYIWLIKLITKYCIHILVLPWKWNPKNWWSSCFRKVNIHVKCFMF